MSSIQINTIMGFGIFIMSCIICLLLVQAGKKSNDETGKPKKGTKILEEWSETLKKKISGASEINIAELTPLWMDITPLKGADQIDRQPEYDEIVGDIETSKKSAVPKYIDISKWFDIKAFVKAMKPYINKNESGGQFMAFSMSNGYVYFMPKVFEEIAKKQAEDAGVLDLAEMKEAEMQNVLLTVTDHLRKVGVFAADLLKKDFFGAYCIITKKTGKPLKGYYIPCHAEAFGAIVEIEAIKTGVLLDFTTVEVVI